MSLFPQASAVFCTKKLPRDLMSQNESIHRLTIRSRRYSGRVSWLNQTSRTTWIREKKNEPLFWNWSSAIAR